MINTNNKISNYDITIMKKNISKLMKDKGITQSQLADATGMYQSRISKILDITTSDCFTIQQLVSIAQALHVSTDSLLGIKTTEKAESKQETTLADICTKLFEIDELTPLSFGVCENGKIETPDSFTEIPLELKSPCIFFENQSVADFIAEWDEIKKINVQNTDLKNKIYSTWKNETIGENKSKFKKYDFKEKRFYQKKLAESLLSDYRSPFRNAWTLLLPDDVNLLKEYVGSGTYILDFDAQEQSMLLDWFKNIEHKSI